MVVNLYDLYSCSSRFCHLFIVSNLSSNINKLNMCSEIEFNLDLLYYFIIFVAEIMEIGWDGM